MPPSTATPTGPVAPVMKLWLTPEPSRFARPIVPRAVVGPVDVAPSTATPLGTLAPVMKLWLTPVPSRFARPIVLVASLVQ